MHDSIRMSISNEAEKKHDGLVIALLNQGWDVKFSRDFLSKKLNSIYAHFMKTGLVDSLGIGFEKLVGEYENYNTEHIVALPLGGMIMGIESLEIGKITLRLLLYHKFLRKNKSTRFKCLEKRNTMFEEIMFLSSGAWLIQQGIQEHG